MLGINIREKEIVGFGIKVHTIVDTSYIYKFNWVQTYLSNWYLGYKSKCRFTYNETNRHGWWQWWWTTTAARTAAKKERLSQWQQIRNITRSTLQDQHQQYRPHHQSHDQSWSSPGHCPIGYAWSTEIHRVTRSSRSLLRYMGSTTAGSLLLLSSQFGFLGLDPLRHVLPEVLFPCLATRCAAVPWSHPLNMASPFRFRKEASRILKPNFDRILIDFLWSDTSQILLECKPLTRLIIDQCWSMNEPWTNHKWTIN